METPTNNVSMLRQEDSVLVVVDVQSRLLPSIHRGDETVRQILKLIRGFQILDAPIVVTEQYRKGLGATHTAIQEALVHPLPADGSIPTVTIDASKPAELVEGFEAIEKMTFSCGAHEPFVEYLRELGRHQVVLCGIEAHVCVLQTALHLREMRFEVFIAGDAINSRSPHNAALAVRRMEQEGVRMTSVEMSIFEMLHECGTEPFKHWLKVIK